MKNIDFNFVSRMFSYVLILAIFIILKMHEKNIFLTALGCIFLAFSFIESSISDTNKISNFKELVFSKLHQTRISNLFRGLALISFLSQLSFTIFK